MDLGNIGSNFLPFSLLTHVAHDRKVYTDVFTNVEDTLDDLHERQGMGGANSVFVGT